MTKKNGTSNVPVGEVACAAGAQPTCSGHARHYKAAAAKNADFKAVRLPERRAILGLRRLNFLSVDDYLVYTHNRFQACRFGLDGTMVNPKTRESIGIREDILASLRLLQPHGVALDSLAALDEIERAAGHHGNHATWLRERFAEHGSVQGVVRSAADLLRL